jgi:phage gpG-like protein
MMKIRAPKPFIPITSAQFQTAVRRGLQNVKQFTVGNTGDNSGLIKREMVQPKTGKTYVISRNGRKRTHIASNASGKESSAVLSGDLKRSIEGRVEGSDRLIISAETPYARIQEKGGLNSRGNYIAPRNNFRRPILSSRGQIKNIILREINRIK